MRPDTLRQPGKKPSLGDGLELDFMRKASSCEPISKASTSDDESFNGGTRGETASDTLLRSPKARAQLKKPISADGTPVSTRSTNFMVGSSEDDDVFADGSNDGSNDGFRGPSSPRRGSEVAVYQEDTRDKVDPQTMYAGSSCMFVANLPQQFHDRKLEEEVTKAFSQFGIVFVKIKRDSRGMPFAFCQYTNDQDAQSAMRLGKGIMILERPCRTEMARAHSSFIVYKYSGQRIRLHEARDLLRRLGQISKAEYLNEGLRAVARLPQTVVVTFKMYDPRRDPPKIFAFDPTYCVKVFDPKALSAKESTPVAAPREGTFLKQYDRDRRSAYVGNLPPSMTKDVLKSLASSCGEVVDVQLHHKEVAGGGGLRTCFGFLEFSRPDAPDELVEAMHDTDIDGYRIRAERKQSRSAEAPRYVPPPACEISYPRYSTVCARAGSFELEKPSDGGYGTPSGNTGRSRQSRPTVLGSDSSPARDIFEPPETTFAGSPYDEARTSRAESLAVPGSSVKKSVEFDLPCRNVSGSSADSGPSAAPVKMASKPTTPKAASVPSTSSARKRPGSRDTEATPAPPTAMPWLPPYPPFGYPYMGAPMTPQANPGLMYAGYMQHPMYHTMYDMYGNMMLSPPHMMPAFNPGPVFNGTPARSDRDNKSTVEPGSETPDGRKSEGKGKEPSL
ncbi:RNA recognition motif domain-containing protein [Hirsutella rhossiliensis]|uniref:RNA recognition motif domain-containing protein n=1 Tax=Hirsutella rhossiliensis TaxID=111463 RepID=A0A9P8SKP9_9HYPO|nr:RNA recognition motif domain-containing protein [Hirsutella rhossiliensis]KAH0964356.1 RNA recognition motif domain-containing protein [Hirsutella rhossiliensis]